MKPLTATQALVPTAAVRPASPCVKLCRIEPASALCVGCWRTLEEITAWRSLDEAGREQVWQRIEQRIQQRMA
jgi:predicted Fe-S protein YdhL (DUF1289 family)